MSDGPSDQSRALLQELVKNPSHRVQIAELKGEDAQCIANFLSMLLHEDGAFASEEGRRLFRLLRRLVKSSEVLPRCYKLQGLQCDFSHAREGGSFADIFEGEYRKRKVCVKAVRIFEKDDNAKMLQAIAKEAVLWAHLFHENILPFYGVYIPKESGRICIISPWMSRGDLFSHLRNYSDVPCLPLILDVITGLRYLHASSIVHGDLKAKNVLISDNGRALITDFGISHLPVSTNLVSTRLSNESMRWMAPELLVEERPPTLLSDIWSFGCVCYKVFTCRIPFYDYANDIQIFSVLMNRTRQPGDANELNNISAKERELMKKCWNYKPESRPSCEDIYQSVVNLVGGRNSAKVEDVALWNTVRSGSTVTVDHMRAHRILLWIKGAHGHFHDYPPSIHPIPTKPESALDSSHNLTYDSPGRSPPPLEPRSAFPASGLNSIKHDPQPNTPLPVDERRTFARFLSFLTPRLPQPHQSHVTDSTNQQQQLRSHPPQLRSSRDHAKPSTVMYRPSKPHRSLLQRYADQVLFRRPANAENYGPPKGHALAISSTPIFFAHITPEEGRRSVWVLAISAKQMSSKDALTTLAICCTSYFFHYRTEDVVILTDDNPQSRHRPTKQNIIQAMQWLVRDTRPNDSLFLHYSGHSGRSRSRDGDGPHGSAEAICPADFRQNGYIVDDLMYDILVKSLPAGCRLTVVFDSWHSGPAFGLPYVYYGGIKGVKVDNHAQIGRSSPADVIVWNVCTNSQAGANTPGAIQATGAMSSAFMAALRGKRDQSYEELLNNTREILQGRVSQLSSSLAPYGHQCYVHMLKD